MRCGAAALFRMMVQFETRAMRETREPGSTRSATPRPRVGWYSLSSKLPSPEEGPVRLTRAREQRTQVPDAGSGGGHMNIRSFERPLMTMVLGLGIHVSTLAVEGAPREVDSPSGDQAGSSWARLGGDLQHGELSPQCGSPPQLVFPVLFAKLTGEVARVTWPPPISSYRFDLVRGSLATLSATQGDFTTATEQCLMDDASVTAFDDPEIPDEGGVYWYLVREDVYQECPAWGSGTYNSSNLPPPQGRQVGDRDPEIGTSGRDCTCYVFCCYDWGTCIP